MNTFDQLGLAAPLLKALAAEGYDHPTPIQIQAIPPVLEGRDLVGLAQTGTGKTAAFALPILQRLSNPRRHAGARACRVLVLAPTRELAAQIADSFRAYGKFIGLSTAVVFGGTPIGKQFKALERGVDILVATPGRLLDLVEQRGCRLDAVETLVLDEADHMMDLGFIVPLRRIAKLLPQERQTLFFSATMPPEIADLAQQFIRDPVRIAVTPVSSTAERVRQHVIHVDGAKKQALLTALLDDKSISRALVFTRTKHGANKVVQRLADEGIAAEAIHGNKSQGQRERALDAFKKGRARLLIATEIAARGIDVENVTHVINFDLPDVPEQYVHRIGRTARAGAEGQAISFCAPDERLNLRDIERLTKQPVPVMEHDLSLATPKPGERAPSRPPRGKQQQQRRPHKASHAHAEHDRGEKRPPSPNRNEHKRGQKKPAHHRDGAHASQGAVKAREWNPDRDGKRDQGDRRDRKGNQVWSNSPPPRGRNRSNGGPNRSQQSRGPKRRG
ncbi:MAG: DEAD/DEAH box helicase [Hyphomonadaceae bacterium]